MLFLKKINQKIGATSVEIAFVLCIVVIIVVIAFPICMSHLMEVRDAADAANLKTAKTAASSEHLVGDISVDGKYYDLDSNTFTSEKPRAYALGTSAGGTVIQIDVSEAGVVSATWVE